MLPALLHESSEVMQICCCHVLHLLLVLGIQKEYITKNYTHNANPPNQALKHGMCVTRQHFLMQDIKPIIQQNDLALTEIHTLWQGSGDLVHHHCKKHS